jgi:hypothetical protein
MGLRSGEDAYARVDEREVLFWSVTMSLGQYDFDAQASESFFLFAQVLIISEVQSLRGCADLLLIASSIKHIFRDFIQQTSNAVRRQAVIV